MSLRYGPLKVVILGTLGHPKSLKVGVMFDANLIDFEDDWDKQCTEINVLFPQ